MANARSEHQHADDEVLYSTDGGIATLTLNRPARLNTISRAMLLQLGELLLKADADPDVRVVILTATGRAFCAGLDMTDATQGKGIGSRNDADSARTTLDLKTAPPIIMFNMEKPTICALNGSAAGYGMVIPLAAGFALGLSKAAWVARLQAVAKAVSNVTLVLIVILMIGLNFKTLVGTLGSFAIGTYLLYLLVLVGASYLIGAADHSTQGVFALGAGCRNIPA